jgi:hypothetical protein
MPHSSKSETIEVQTAQAVDPAANCSPELFEWLQLQADKWLTTAKAVGHNHADYADLRRMSWAFRFVSEEISKANDQDHLSQRGSDAATQKDSE